MRFNGFNVRPLSLVACFVFLSAIWHSVLLLLATNSSEPTLSTRPLGGGHAGSRHSTTPLALPSLCPFASYTRFANVTALALSVSPYGYSSRSYWRAHRALDDSLDGSAPLGTAVVRALEASRTPSHAGADVASLPALNAATLTLELQRVLWDHYGAPNAQSNGGSDAPAPPSALLVDMNSVLCCGDVIGCTSDERAANATAGDGAACGDAAVVDRCVSAAHDVVASLARVATACGWRALVVGVYPDSPLRTITRSPRVIATTATAMAASTMARAQRQWCAMRALSALLANVSAAAVVSPRVQVVRIVAGRALSAQPSADDVRALCATLHGLVGCAPRGGDTAAVRGVVTAKRALSLHYDAYVAASLGAAELQTWLLETYKGDEFAWKVYGAEMRAEFERLRVANGA